MFVRDRMSSPAVTVKPDTPFQQTMRLMKEKGFGRFPVVDDQGKIVGIVSEVDLMHASPSPATSLSVWELHDLLSRLQIQEIMTQEVVTTSPGATIEEAASQMVKHQIGALPVVNPENLVVGIITETDIFQTFVDLFGGGQAGLRLTLQVPNKKGVIAKLSDAIFKLGGNIASVGTYPGAVSGKWGMVIKVQDVNKEQLVDMIESLGDQVIDAQDVQV